MRLGLLVCDHVRDQHLDEAGDYPDHFRALFAGHPEIELVAYDVINGEFPADPNACDAWITTGSRHSVNDDLEWIRDLEQFVRDAALAGVPFVGVCFGHQLLAKAMGGRVANAESGWTVGSVSVETTDGSFRVMNMHHEQVSELPAGAEVLGWSDTCPVAVMSVGETMLGIQGHPEMTVPYNRALIELRRGGIIPDGTADRGLRSLDEPPDSGALADWIVSFISHSGRRKSHI